MANIETGNSTTGLVNIDANNDMMTSTPQVSSRYGGATGAPDYVGASRLFCENDSGVLSGTSWLNSPFVTAEDNLQVGVMTPLLDYTFNGITQDTSMWYYAFTTMTATAAGGFLLLNATNIGTAATGAYLQSRRYFNLTGNGGIRFGTTVSITLAAAANEIWYVGLGVVSTTTAPPTDGVWFRSSSAGLIGVVTYNGNITQTGVLPVVNPLTIPINSVQLLQIRIHDRIVYFMYNGEVIGSIATPTGQAFPFITNSLPAFIQYVNTGTVAGSNFMQLKVGTITIDQLDSNIDKPFPHIQAAKGLMAYQGQQGGTMGTTALYSNNLAAAAGAAMTNTTAALGTGFGGQFSWLPTLAVPTDGIVCSYQNPTGSVTQTPRTLYITGVRIQSIVTTVFVGGPVYALYSLAFGHTALSLATAETGSFVTASAKAPRRIPLGMETFPTTAAVGTTSATGSFVSVQFASPIVVNASEYVAITAKNIGTVTFKWRNTYVSYLRCISRIRNIDMANIENGSSTAGLANVDANYDLMTSTPQVNSRYGGLTGAPNYVGASRIFCENDAGTLSGTSWLNSPFVTAEDNLQVGVMTPLLDYAFTGTSQDTSMWYYAFTTMTATQSSGYLLLNSGNIGTTTTGVYMQSKRYFNLTGNAGIRFGTTINITFAAVANETWYVGLGIPTSTTAAPTDGVWFQYSSAGLIGSVAYNGTVTSTGALPTVNPITIPVNTAELLQIRIHDRVVYFMYNGEIIGSILTPAAQAYPFITDSLPVFVQQVNTGTVSGGSFMQLKVGTMVVDQLDSNIDKPFPHIQAAKGLMAYQGQQGGTMGTTALYSNNLAAAAGAAMTNTTAALGTGFGGQFSWLPTLVAGTDGILCSYQNPAGGISQIPRTIYITGIRIQSVVTAAFTGGPVYELYSLAFGHTALSLATAESASFANGTTKAPRRIPLGIETFVVSAAVGAISGTPPIVMQFASPIIVNPGEFVAIAAKNIGTVTSVGAILTLATFDAYLE